jgi:beta-glucosidase
MNHRRCRLVGIAPLVPLSVLAVAVRPSAARPAPPGGDVERRIAELLARMTIEEKVGQLQQLDGDPNTGRPRDEHRDLVRRGLVGAFLNVRGARNVNEIQRIAVEQSRLKIPVLLGFDVIHGYRTVFPIPLGEASSWDPAAAERSARVAAAEASAAGVKWTFAPMVDIARDPRWGRIAEGAGEDPYLGSAMARARVRGFQGDDPADPDRVLACAKHWVAYGAAEAGRDYNAADLSERTLRSVYFPPFRAALEAGAGTIMSSFNTINGLPASANPFTLTEVLRGEWKFDGFVVSDYEAIKDLVAHGVAADGAEAARLALAAGVDMEMVSRLFGEHLPRLVEQGQLPRATLDEAVRRVLRIKFRLGLFERPYADEAHERTALASRENQAAAREIAGRSMVLLKNERGVLPLGGEIRSIAVVGPLADDREATLGPWHGDGKAEDVVTLLAGIKAKVAGRPGVKVAYARGCAIEGGSTDGLAEAVQMARGANLAIVAVGESAEMSGEAASRSALDLPGHQLDLVKAVHATGTPTVVVLMNGRPLTIGWVAAHVPAILEAWLAGTRAGDAIADVLFGDLNPGGKLPVTFPRVVGQVPLYYNHLNTGRPSSDAKYTSKYIDVPVGPLFAFGHGLSYTRFQLSGLRLSDRQIPADGRLDVRVDVANVGERAGDEVVQLYIRDVAASVARPVQELRGFERVSLRPGEKKTVRFTLTPQELGFYDHRMRFVVELGEFRVTAGTSSVGGLEDWFEVVGPPHPER